MRRRGAIGQKIAKKCMPIYGIIGIFREVLAHNLAKSQYFSVRPSLFDYYNQITYYLKSVDFISKKLQKFHKISHISVCAKKASRFTFFNIFA